MSINPPESGCPPEGRRLLLGICDRHNLLRSALESLIRPEADLQVVWSVASLPEAEASAAQVAPDILIVDFSRPTPETISQLERFKGACPHTHIVALTDHGSDECVLYREETATLGLGQPRTCCLQQAFMLGARGAVSKTSSPEELLRVIHGVAQGKFMVEEPAFSTLLNKLFATTRPAQPRPHLTGREHEVIESLVRGLSNKEIGARLGIREQTVKNHITHILDKLGLNDRLQIVVYAARSGLIRIDDC